MSCVSMTGFGGATTEGEDLRVSCECRSVNGRTLRIQVKAPESLRALESKIEKRIKSELVRGSVQVSVRVEQTDLEALVDVNEDVVKAYQTIFTRLGLDAASIPSLPGVISPKRFALTAEHEVLVLAALDSSLAGLSEMRVREGQALLAHLLELTQQMEAERVKVLQRAPGVLAEYRARLAARVDELLDGSGVSVDEAALAREVAVFATRCDVNEEVERIASHLDQVRSLLMADEASGRTLEFLAQELHREVNTIGSKSSDLELARAVIALKALVDRFKEQVANIE